MFLLLVDLNYKGFNEFNYINIGSCTCNNRKVTEKLKEQEHFPSPTKNWGEISWDFVQKRASAISKECFENQQLCHHWFRKQL